MEQGRHHFRQDALDVVIAGPQRARKDDAFVERDEAGSIIPHPLLLLDKHIIGNSAINELPSYLFFGFVTLHERNYRGETTFLVARKRERGYTLSAMEKILVSACLLGENTRYDGGNNFFPFLEELSKYYELVPFCPEMAAGLGTPRPKAEIRGGSVLSIEGKDLTKEYVASSEEASRLCRFLSISCAILKDGSPACGVRLIHDGTFSGTKKDGKGITARKLESMGIKVYCEHDNLSFLLPPSKEEKEIEKQKNIKKKAEKDAKYAEKKRKALENKDKEEKTRYEKKPQEGYRKREGTPYKKKDGSSFKKKEGSSYSKGKPSYGNKKTGGYSQKRNSSSSYRKDKPSYPKKEGQKRSFGSKAKTPYKAHSFPQNSRNWGSSKSRNKVTKK